MLTVNASPLPAIYVIFEKMVVPEWYQKLLEF
jgi:hypothetical protein